MRRGAPTRRPAAPIASGSEAPGELAVRAWVRILAVQKHALAAIRDELEREMTMPRVDLLANVCRADGQTLASLSRSMLVTASNDACQSSSSSSDSMPSNQASMSISIASNGSARTFSCSP